MTTRVPSSARQVLAVILLGFGFACASASAAAQPQPAAGTYPVKPVRLIVPFAPGGPNDFLARALAGKLAEAWGHPVVIDNRGGAGGTVGTEMGIRSPRDGYTLFMGGASTLTVAPSLYRKLAYDPLKDVAPIVPIARVPYLWGLNPQVAAKSVSELIALARARPGTLTYGSSGTGSMSSLAAEMVKSIAQIDLVHVPYKGTAPAITDVIGGQISMMLADLAVILPHVRTGRLRALAVTGERRSALAPDIATMTEAGLKGYDLNVWFGLFAPAGTPRAVIDRINADALVALKSPDLIERFARQGYEPLGSGVDELARYVTDEIARLARLIKQAGIRAD